MPIYTVIDEFNYQETATFSKQIHRHTTLTLQAMSTICIKQMPKYLLFLCGHKNFQEVTALV
jgi:hypothetical protein